ncbi:MAG TPA: insulinase family protein [Rectinemataceae bacterium]|nr:insulinase family protein [Rectinemataceae bacterium]
MKRTLLATFIMLAVAVSLVAESTQLPNLYHFRLPNGLELYVYRDPSLPLLRTQISFKAGAIAQRADNAGIFRVYERTVFGGDPGRPGSAPIRDAMADLGLGGVNGGTGAEGVSYWTTLPATRLDACLGFWALVAVNPQLDASAFAQAVADSGSEATAQDRSPSVVYESAMTRRLFAKYPWRRDPAGSPKTISGLSLDDLAALQRTWFVPNNAALFIGGDIDPEAALAAVERHFGAWKAADDPWKKPLPPHPRPGVMRPTWIALADPRMPQGTAAVEMRYRGPDLGTDAAPSYAADLWSSLVAPSEGRFKKALMKDVPGLLGPDSITTYYVSQRDGGWISIGALLRVDPASSTADRIRNFKERVRGYEITSMKIDPNYFTAEDFEAARQRLLAIRNGRLGSVDGMISALSFWWSAASVDYFLGYADAVEKTGPKEVSAFLDTYIMRNLEIVALRMNPDDFEQEQRGLEASGFETVGSGNVFWWQR